jgi:hypothetical protein
MDNNAHTVSQITAVTDSGFQRDPDLMYSLAPPVHSCCPWIEYSPVLTEPEPDHKIPERMKNSFHDNTET